MKDERKTKRRLLDELKNLLGKVARLEASETKRKPTEEKYSTIIQTALDGFQIIDLKGRYLAVNDSFCRTIGYTREELLQMSIPDVEAKEDPEETARHIKHILEQGSDRFETRVRGKDGKIIALEVSVTYSAEDGGELIVFSRDITERKRAEKREKLAHDVLKLLNQSGEKIDITRDILLLIKEFTGIEAVGIRLREGEDFPYYEVNGFPADFVEAENYLCARGPDGAILRDAAGTPYLECMCGNIISRRTDPSLPFFTAGGSFWTNSTTELLATTTEKDRQTSTRNRCNSQGYESMALIPLRAEDKIIGLLQLNDSRRNCFTKEMIHFFEGIGASIGIALARIRADEALKKSAQLLRDTGEMAKVGGWELDLATQEVLWTEEVARIHRVEPGYFPKLEEALNFYAPESRPALEAVLKKAAETGEPYDLESLFIPSGSKDKIWVRSLGKAVFSGGKIVKLAGTFQNIDKYKRAEEALRESEERFRLLFQNVNDAVYLHEIWEKGDGRFRFLEVNEVACKRLGYSREEFLQMTVADIDVPEQIPKVPDIISLIFRDKSAIFETEHRAKDGRRIPVEVSVRLFELGGQPTLLSVTRDITERKQAEEELRKSEELYRSLFENAAEGFFMASADGTLTMVNPELRNLTGFSEEEIKGKKFLDFLHPEEVPRLAALYANVLQTKKTDLAVLEFRALGKDGRVLYFHCRPIPILHHGKITGFHGIMTNITERKQAEEARRESENKYKTLVENLPQKVFLKDRNLVYVSCNENYARDLRISPDDILGKTDYDFYPGDLAEKYRADDRRIIESGETEDLEERYVQDGKKFDVYTVKTPVKDADGKVIGVLGIFWDITERKRLEEQLHEAMKMEAMGRLAGGVAHDFNNALTSIMAISQLLLEDLASSHPIYEDIKNIRESGERCANLTRQLLAFARHQPFEPKVLNLNEVVINIEKMLSHVIGEDIELVKSLDPELGNTKADVGQMEQIIVNLAVNARDAMPRGGKLTIETANVSLDPEYASKNLGVTPGPYVRLTISDTGVGMDEETRAKAFEPFFTTKGPGKGTGLGLPTVYGIVKQSGGNIWVYSEPGQGTTLKIHLPRVEEEAEAVGGREPALTGPLRASETILLVEDEEGVRRTTKRILIKSGYQVLEASNGQEALELCGRHPGPIHLLITDVVMPGMSGKELADRLALSFPAMKFLYISGYADNAVVNHGILEAGASFLPKPFTIESLNRKLREVLDR